MVVSPGLLLLETNAMTTKMGLLLDANLSRFITIRPILGAEYFMTADCIQN